MGQELADEKVQQRKQNMVCLFQRVANQFIVVTRNQVELTGLYRANTKLAVTPDRKTIVLITVWPKKVDPLVLAVGNTHLFLACRKSINSRG